MHPTLREWLLDTDANRGLLLEQNHGAAVVVCTQSYALRASGARYNLVIRASTSFVISLQICYIPVPDSLRSKFLQ